TGVESEIPFAIPHAGYEYTIKSVIAIAILIKPVSFMLASNPNSEVFAKVVLIPAIKSDSQDSMLLYKIVQMINKPSIIAHILKLGKKEEILKYILLYKY
ncbi:MAG: PTS sugar transporter subunit IIA, partial [Nitrososphaeria archaeon]